MDSFQNQRELKTHTQANLFCLVSPGSTADLVGPRMQYHMLTLFVLFLYVSVSVSVSKSVFCGVAFVVFVFTNIWAPVALGLTLRRG